MSRKGVTKKRSSPWAYAIVQADGSFRAADDHSRELLRSKGLKRMQRVRFKVEAERDYTQWKKAHALGTLIAQNLEDFAEFMRDDGKVDSHGALKKLQRLSGVECEQMELEIPGIGKLTVNQPLSLAFDEMDEIRFENAYTGLCQYLVAKYWHELDRVSIEEMASLVGMAA